MFHINSIFGLYQKALSIREEKLTLISSNISNQDTPNFKARDIDFKQAINSEKSSLNANLPLKSAGNRGFSGFGTHEAYQIKYRKPIVDSLDGNTVDGDVEKTEFMNNVVRYNSTLAFIQAKKAALMEAIKGD